MYRVSIILVLFQCAGALRLGNTLSCMFDRDFDAMLQAKDFGYDGGDLKKICEFDDTNDMLYHGCASGTATHPNLPTCIENTVHHACHDQNGHHEEHQAGLPECDVNFEMATPDTKFTIMQDGCCNSEYDDSCSAKTCTCDEASFPQQNTHDPFPSAADARKALSGKTIYFVGDSTTRRLMYAFCSYLGEKTFFDRHGAFHHDIVCPETGHNDLKVGEASITLHFQWNPEVLKLPKKTVTKATKADFIITSIYHHDLMHNAGEVGKFTQGVVAWGKDVTSDPTGPTVVLVGPNLVGGTANIKNIGGTEEGNNVLLLSVSEKYRNLVKEANNPRLIAVGNEWMRNGPDGLKRHACLGGEGTHVRYSIGQLLRVQNVLTAIAPKL